MRRELHYFDIYPKVIPAGKVSRVTIKCTERRYKAKNGEKIRIRVMPMTESLENVEGRSYHEIEAISENGIFTFKYCFDKEQEYRINVYVSDNDFFRLSVYALEEDLYSMIPLKGDFHVHSNYSDGWESPEAVAAYYREAGYDFTVLSDHGNYQGSVAAKEFYKDIKIDMNIVNGEEVHAPGNHIHIVNFGGEFSVNELFEKDPARYDIEVKDIENGLDSSLIFSSSSERFEYASCLWVYRQIRRGNGLAVFAHPHWIVDTYHVRDSMTLLQFKNKCFDAFELVGGMSPKENNMQLAMYHTACKNGYGEFPIVGSSDSHGAVRESFSGSSFEGWENNPYGFDELQTIVFASSNDKNDIISAVKNGFSVAVERYRGETPRVYGDYRLVSYALFLLSDYFPLHDEICREEGRLMKQLTFENEDGTKQDLEGKSGRVDKMIMKYFRETSSNA